MIRNLLKQNSFLKQFYYNLQYKYWGELRDNNYKYFPYPWQQAYTERISRIKAKAAGQKAVAFIYPAAEPGTFRYRSYNPSQVLNKTESYVANYFFAAEIKKLQENIDLFDLLIFTRVEWSPEAAELIKLARAKGIKTVFDFDDLVFNVDFVPELLEQIAAPRSAHGYYFYYVAIIYSLAKLCDSYLATNQFLADKVAQHFNKPCAVIPNFINDEQLEIAARINSGEFPEVNNARKEQIIGYFSGTKTHDRDFQLIEDDVLKILADYPHTKFMLVGHLNLSAEFDKFQQRIMRTGLKNFVDLQKYIAMCSINLIPLVINDFTNSKSELKFFEAGLVKVPSIAAPTFVYQQSITDGENGLLAKEGEWYEKIKLLLADSKKRTEIAENAYTYAQENYSGPKITTKVERVIREFF